MKRLSESALFVSVFGSVDAVVWPNHYADIQLKHPEKRYKAGGPVKGRVSSRSDTNFQISDSLYKVLVVDPDRKRICLTLKKSLLESQLPIVADISDCKPGMIVHATVFKALDNGLLVEFYNNLKGFIPQREIRLDFNH